jgi:chemotaxis protein methyltransferase CheR
MAMNMLTSDQFDRTRKLALQMAGIQLLDRHRELLDRRSQRLGLHESAKFAELLEAAETGDPQARRLVIDLITTNYTGFFRHPAHFDIAAGQALRAAQARGRALIWSAAAATGEEPYSLGIALIERFGRSDPPASILATDIDQGALAIAQKGEYGDRSLQVVDPERRGCFFRSTESASSWTISPVVRRLVEFRSLSLTSSAWPIQAPIDVIFCRNVLMYLDPNHREAVIPRLTAMLATDGILILDPTEHLGRASHDFFQETQGVYRRRAEVGRRPLPTGEDAISKRGA